jgi:hypothetical protein
MLSNPWLQQRCKFVILFTGMLRRSVGTASSRSGKNGVATAQATFMGEKNSNRKLICNL